MKLSAKRRIDYLLGRPLCALLGRGVRIADRLRPRPADTGRVLFIQLSEMGSPVLAAPAIQRIQARSSADPCFVILERNVHSLRLMGLIRPENIFALADGSLRELATGAARFAAFCREREVEVAVDLELFSRVSAILSVFSGARVRAGFHNYEGEGLYRGDHLTHPVNYSPYQHMSQNFMALAMSLEAPLGRPGPKQEIPVPRSDVRVAPRADLAEELRASLRSRFPLEDRHRLVLINHDAGKLLPIRTWPAERYSRLIQRLLDHDEDLLCVLVGVEEGRESAERIQAEVGDERCVDFVGRTRTLEHLVQLFHMSELLVTNDSGPAHFATLTPISVITLFGPETPTLYGPLGERAVNLYTPLACSPCLTAANHRNSPCEDNVCLQSITVGQVFEHASLMLARESSKTHG